ncbi:hypothetical protein D9758_011436 [Tetrapyrgos nigripes]|uniref:Uncharacterized protein n=1 Tax=Tetrapyrgos nigripes TaxID=182062 RepID=A0A8H5CQ41_9AGAR|nr:hypothetical protein D9758_011436 [Tetrapyrgos nigripes]
MFKFITATLLLVFATSVIAQEPLGLDGQCGTIVGTKPCAEGLKCCYLNPDDGVCKPASFEPCLFEDD